MNPSPRLPFGKLPFGKLGSRTGQTTNDERGVFVFRPSSDPVLEEKEYQCLMYNISDIQRSACAGAMVLC
jgi:hypothetical protein